MGAGRDALRQEPLLLQAKDVGVVAAAGRRHQAASEPAAQQQQQQLARRSSGERGSGDPLGTQQPGGLACLPTGAHVASQPASQPQVHPAHLSPSSDRRWPSATAAPAGEGATGLSEGTSARATLPRRAARSMRDSPYPPSATVQRGGVNSGARSGQAQRRAGRTASRRPAVQPFTPAAAGAAAQPSSNQQWRAQPGEALRNGSRTCQAPPAGQAVDQRLRRRLLHNHSPKLLGNKWAPGIALLRA